MPRPALPEPRSSCVTRALLVAGCWLAAVAVPAKATTAAPPAERMMALTGWLQQAGRAKPPALVLLGEVHDHAGQHAARLQAFEALLATGARPALLLEQFDREHQPALDALRHQGRGAGPAPDADALIRLADPSGRRWRWDFYRPFIALALAHDLPLIAANVSRSEARQVIGQGLAATGFNHAVPAALQQAQAAAIVASHCGAVDEALATRMAAAQIARDQFMARQLAAQQARGAVLLAGNGHVRRDIGVPQWLPPELRERALSIGLLERGDNTPESAYDRRLVTAAQPRPDPCAALRGPAASASSPAQTRP